MKEPILYTFSQLLVKIPSARNVLSSSRLVPNEKRASSRPISRIKLEGKYNAQAAALWVTLANSTQSNTNKTKFS